MSARIPFQFPGNQSTGDRADSETDDRFSPGLDNLLNVSQKEDLPSGSSRKENRNPFANGAFKTPGNGAPAHAVKSTTNGLSSLRKRASAQTLSSTTPTENVTVSRPVTADPFSRTFQSQAPVVAPAPQKATRIFGSFGMHSPKLSDVSSLPTFKVPFASVSNVPTDPKLQNQAHISTSDVQNGGRIASDGFIQEISFRPSSRANGPQRVPIEQGPAILNPFRQKHQFPNVEDGNVENDKTAFNPACHNRKRSRDDAEDEMSDYEPSNVHKRAKGQDEYTSETHVSRKHALSPSTVGRPSSGMSHGAVHNEHHNSVPQLYYGYPGNSAPGPKRYSPYDAPRPPVPASSALAKLIGIDPDAYVQDHMDTYDKTVERFENCTIDEWRAAADEIAVDFHALLDRVKKYMDTKLKLYSDLHAEMQAHSGVLQDRENALEGARKKLVNEGADVLK